jgi:N-acetylmuramoyl-L-alanine amidase
MLNVVVLDPAHGGSDSGARGASGINESDVVLEFAKAVKAALEAQGLRVVQTRVANDGPSFDDRSAISNGQRGAIFITLHVSSTGTPGQVRVYCEPLTPGLDPSAPINFPARNGLLPWDRAQEPYAAASRKLAELTQTGLAQKFPGSPTTPLIAAVRQLRTVAAPAIAIEASSVSITNRDQLIQMAPGIANAVTQAVAAFRPIYEGASH